MIYRYEIKNRLIYTYGDRSHHCLHDRVNLLLHEPQLFLRRVIPDSGHCRSLGLGGAEVCLGTKWFETKSQSASCWFHDRSHLCDK